MTKLTAYDVRSLLWYSPQSGKMYWKPRPDRLFADPRTSTSWNSRHAGREAFTASLGEKRPYKIGSLFGRNFYAHRVAWLVSYGQWPGGPLDHINGIHSDNRLANLREVSVAENNRNMPRLSTNTSGVVGVKKSPTTSKWDASIYVDGRFVWLGCHARFEDAVAARKAAERKFGYHINHGRQESRA